MQVCIGRPSDVKRTVDYAKTGDFSPHTLTVEDNPEHKRILVDGTLIYAALKKDAKTWIVRYDPTFFAFS